MERWRGRVALVTGASAGIGASICRELAAQGMRVIGCARNVQRIRDMAEEEARKGGEIIAIQCDVRKEEEIMSMFSEIRRIAARIDVCVNNAGLSFECPLLEGRTDQWRTMLDVNVLGLCICTREAIKLMKEKDVDDGQIIHMSSMSGHRIPEQTSFLYVGTKCMVKALTEGLRRELRAENSTIRVADNSSHVLTSDDIQDKNIFKNMKLEICNSQINSTSKMKSISPGLVETEFEYRCFAGDPAIAREIYESIRCMQPKDIAQAVLYVLKAPHRVDVQDILMRPTEQVV